MFKKVVCWAVVGLVVVGFLSGVGSAEDVIPNQKSPPIAQPRVYTPHAPIRINNDTDFTIQFANRTIWGLEINGTAYGDCIYIGNCSLPFTVKDCYLHNATDMSSLYFCGAGLCLNNVMNGTLQNINAFGNYWGEYVFSSSNNSITNCNVSGNFEGIMLNGPGSNNNISHNIVCGNTQSGIDTYAGPDDNIIGYNNVSDNNYCGIALGSRSNILINNILYNNGIYFGLGSDLFGWTSQSIDTGNLVNNKPIYYYINQNGGTVPSNAGQVILANSSNMTISGLSIKKASFSVQLGYSAYNSITNNVLIEDLFGITLGYSNNNIVDHNNLVGNNFSYYGIMLGDSNQNTINRNNISSMQHGIHVNTAENNTVTNNNVYCSIDGIVLVVAKNNVITNNTIYSASKYGIEIIYVSTGNHFYHNNLLSNNGGGKQANDTAGGNYWNTSTEGNYWSDWKNPDNNHDGIVDLPYTLDGGAGATDYFPIADTNPPKIEIISPKNGDILNGNVTIDIKASDDHYLYFVNLSINGTIVDSKTDSFTYAWNTMQTTNGLVNLSTEAMDASNNHVWYNITVNVYNWINHAPDCSITFPVNGDLVNGTITITGTASDSEGDTGLVKVEVKIDNSNWNSAIGTDSWSYSWDTTTVLNGTHTIYACSIDNRSTNSTEMSVDINVQNQNHPPVCTIDYPKQNEVVKSNITITGTASDPDGNFSISKVEVRIDTGIWKPAIGTISWNLTWDTTTVSDGSHQLYARSTDVNSAYSNPIIVTVTVNNSVEDRGNITVFVADSMTEEVLMSANVTIPSLGLTKTTDNSGYSNMTNIPSGNYDITISKTGYADSTRSVTVNKAETTTINFYLIPITSIDTQVMGKVMDNSTGNPIDNVMIRIDNYTTKSSSDGKYSLKLPAGNYTLNVTKDGYKPYERNIHVDLGNNTIDIRLEPVELKSQPSSNIYMLMTIAMIAVVSVALLLFAASVAKRRKKKPEKGVRYKIDDEIEETDTSQPEPIEQPVEDIPQDTAQSPPISDDTIMEMPVDDAYNILGISSDSSKEEVRNAYRRLAKKWHPDKLVNKNPDEIKEAKEKYLNIKNAYEQIKIERGW